MALRELERFESLDSTSLYMRAEREERLAPAEERMLAFRVEQGVFVGGIPPSQLATEINACFRGPCYEALQTSLETFNFNSFDEVIEAGRYKEIITDVSGRCKLDKRATRKKLQKISVAQHIKEAKPDACSWEEYTRDIKTRAREAEDRFEKGNLALVISIARKHPQSSVMGFMDIVQEGNAGLIKAVRQYDYRLGLRFSTYATRWIDQTITRAIAGNQPLETPDNVVGLVPRLLKKRDMLAEDLNRAPTLEELAEALKLKIDVVTGLIRVSQGITSLNKRVGEDTTELWQLVGDPDSLKDVEEANRRIDNDTLRRKLEEIAGCLTDVEREALFAQYGVGFARPLSPTETEKLLGIPRQVVVRARQRAMEKMERPARRRQLRPYL